MLVVMKQRSWSSKTYVNLARETMSARVALDVWILIIQGCFVGPFPHKDALVAGQRVGRKDTWSKRFASRFANGLRSWFLKDGTRDTGCGLKAFRRDAFLALPFFNHMHRFLPALFKRDGWTIALVDVTHRPRVAGRSNYNNFNRAVVGIYDLFGVAWLIRRRKHAAARNPEIVSTEP